MGEGNMHMVNYMEIGVKFSLVSVHFYSKFYVNSCTKLRKAKIYFNTVTKSRSFPKPM